MKFQLEQKDIVALAEELGKHLKPMSCQGGCKRMEDVIFDVEGLSKYLDVETSWIYKKASERKIPFFKTGKYLKFKKSAIDKWIQGRTVNPL